jgi:saccharopine dehydrogenase-like NADP-dependent oxidoreductase
MRKVEGHSSLRRSTNGSVISVDKTALARAKAQKAKDEELKRLRVEVDQLTSLINSINTQLQELKTNGR